MIALMSVNMNLHSNKCEVDICDCKFTQIKFTQIYSTVVSVSNGMKKFFSILMFFESRDQIHCD